MSEAEQRKAVVDAAFDWLTTPYHNNARVKGAGVDCAQLPAAVYHTAGIIPFIEPDYAHDWHMHRGEELYVQWIHSVGGSEIDDDKVGPGDFIIWRFGRTFSHGAIFVNPPTIIHAYREAGMVTLDNWTQLEELMKRPHQCFTFWPKA